MVNIPSSLLHKPSNDTKVVFNENDKFKVRWCLEMLEHMSKSYAHDKELVYNIGIEGVPDSQKISFVDKKLNSNERYYHNLMHNSIENQCTEAPLLYKEAQHLQVYVKVLEGEKEIGSSSHAVKWIDIGIEAKRFRGLQGDQGNSQYKAGVTFEWIKV
jgi:hypothetical protein